MLNHNTKPCYIIRDMTLEDIMKKRYIITIAVLVGILMTSCALKRNNPLDPIGGDTIAPARVTGLFVPEYSNGSVNLSWDAQDIAESYYIYRSHTYDGFYNLVEAVIATEADSLTVTHESFDDVMISGEWYFFIVSAVNAEGLEGQRSLYQFTYFTNGKSDKVDNDLEQHKKVSVK